VQRLVGRAVAKRGKLTVMFDALGERSYARRSAYHTIVSDIEQRTRRWVMSVGTERDAWFKRSDIRVLVTSTGSRGEYIVVVVPAVTEVR
jgi:hypothetical protein